MGFGRVKVPSTKIVKKTFTELVRIFTVKNDHIIKVVRTQTDRYLVTFIYQYIFNFTHKLDECYN